jgi:hypothetical protein
MTPGVRRVIVDLWRDLALRAPVAGQNRLFREIDRFALCCTAARAVYGCKKDGSEFGVPISCNSRICDQCGRRLYFRLSQRLTAFLRPYTQRSVNSYSLKFLTLTFAGSRFDGYPTAADLMRCRKEAALMLRLFFGRYFARLSDGGKLSVCYKKPVGRGAFAVVEVGGGGLIHFHCLVYGPVIPHAQLKAAWERITVDSSIVDIREVKGQTVTRRGRALRKSPAARAVDYVLKYVTKPPDNHTFAALPRYALMLKGSRRFSAFGVFYGQVSTRAVRRGQRFCCLYCGGPLKFAGQSGSGRPINARGQLLDWHQYAKYVDTASGVYLRDMSVRAFPLARAD